MFEHLFANSGLSLERLRTFREIVTAGGITAAAGDDSNRQSQYSRQLKELEKYFGVELLKRGHGPAELTDAGQRLYEIIGHTLSALDEFRLTCAGQSVELTIGAGESLIQWLLLPRLSGLAAAHPKLTVTFQNLKTDEILSGLVDGGLDFGVVSRFEPHRALASAPLVKLDFCLFAPAKLLPANERLKLRSDMEADEDQERRFQLLSGECRGRSAHQQRKTDIVSEDVVVMAPPIQGVILVTSQRLGNNSQAINVRDHPCPSYERALTFVERRCSVRDRPAHEEMRNWAHSSCGQHMKRLSATQSGG
jgi:DNA-binding transcriptional LysR family regulator